MPPTIAADVRAARLVGTASAFEAGVAATDERFTRTVARAPAVASVTEVCLGTAAATATTAVSVAASLAAAVTPCSCATKVAAATSRTSALVSAPRLL